MMCTWDTSKFLIFSDNGIPLIYYSHLTSIAIFFLLFVITFLPLRPWPKAAFRTMMLVYITWLFGDLVLWGNENINHILFFWSVVNLVEPLIFVASYIHFVSFSEKRHITMREFITFAVLLFPTLIMSFTRLSVTGFDYTNCDRNVIEGVAAYYNYFLEAVFTGLLAIAAFKQWHIRRLHNQGTGRVLLVGASLILLLLSFLAANFLGTYFEAYNISQLGHIAVPIFAALLVYVTVKFETFEPRVLIADVSTGTLLILIFSLFFIRDANTQIYIISGTFLLAVIFAYFLVSGIRKEVDTRQHIQTLATDLSKANNRLVELDKQKSEFVSFATHQLKSPLAAMRGYASLILDGDYGEISTAAREPLSRIFESTKTLANVVEGYLNISRIELGTMKYDFTPHDIRAMVSDVIAELEPNTKKAGINLSFEVNKEDDFIVQADPDKLKQVFANLIDNSVKYTPTGSVNVSVTKKQDPTKGTLVLFSVKDTGIGMSEKTIESLFHKFTRAYNANKTNIHGTGLGLFVAKEIVEAHKGHVWAESEGEGKGSQFYVELPSVK